MRLVTVIAVIPIIILFPYIANSASPCSTDDKVAITDGNCWNTLAQIQKQSIIRGIWSGIKIGDMKQALIGNTFHLIFDHTSAPASTNVGDYVDYIDKLYSFPVNREISWPYAYLLAVLWAKDDDSNDRLTLIRFLRDNEELPTYVNLVNIQDIDRLVIESNNKQYELKLAGISTANLDQKDKERATALLNKFKSMTWFSCGGEAPTLELRYIDEFFYKDGTLTAHVYPMQSFICLGNEKLSIQEGLGFNASLNQILVRKGLAEPEYVPDNQWSEDRKKARQLPFKYNYAQAKEEKLYIYGGKTDDWVESLLANKRVGLMK